MKITRNASQYYVALEAYVAFRYFLKSFDIPCLNAYSARTVVHWTW